ncbi:MAG TPA: hypothetical protein VF845_14375 [Terriglobales bacterium]
MPINCFSDAHSKSAAKRALALASVFSLTVAFASSNRPSGNEAPAPLANASTAAQY